ncbi:hypothetical protein [Limnoglobus roseus]|uniref:Uncharacterized protein n=1 Tax=Limnoglobus roseus TaxID=2598579 RepID=A0A5C1AML4_9BACT|nr:hypothetical protein [Limnoglobus roseus]QEL19377.1 hypothetical protein PX52LOC_06448 [Limnoglobus roseus]
MNDQPSHPVRGTTDAEESAKFRKYAGRILVVVVVALFIAAAGLVVAGWLPVTGEDSLLGWSWQLYFLSAA